MPEQIAEGCLVLWTKQMKWGRAGCNKVARQVADTYGLWNAWHQKNMQQCPCTLCLDSTVHAPLADAMLHIVAYASGCTPGRM